jgi:UDP-N-acetylmuramate dehydrogenase
MIEKNVSLQCLNSYCLPGTAEYYYHYYSENELADVLRWARRKKMSVHILGGGSNILLTRPLIEGLVIHMGPRFLYRKGETLIAGSGVDTSLAVLQALRHGLSGAEFLYGLPGNLGGALFMNARAYDRSLSDIIVSAKVMDETGHTFWVTKSDMALDYKDSVFQHRSWVILALLIQLQKGDREAIQEEMSRSIDIRRSKGHYDFPSCGSVFKNPYHAGIPAGKLVEELSLKGRQAGGAEIFFKHGNFIINKDSACAEDIMELLNLIRDEAREKRGIILTPEVDIW